MRLLRNGQADVFFTVPFPAGGSGVCDGFPGGQGLRVVVSFRDAGGRFLRSEERRVGKECTG